MTFLDFACYEMYAALSWSYLKKLKVSGQTF